MDAEQAEPLKSAERLKEAGNVLCAAGLYTEAAQLYTQAIDALRKLPDTPERNSALGSAYSNLSFCRFNVGDFEAALRDADACVRCRPKWAKAHFRRAAALLQLGLYKESILAYDAGLIFEPKNAPAISGRADATMLSRATIVQPNAPQPHRPPARTRASPAHPPPPAARQRELLVATVETQAPWLLHPPCETKDSALHPGSIFAHRRIVPRGALLFLLSNNWWSQFTKHVAWYGEDSGEAPGLVENNAILEEDGDAEFNPKFSLRWGLRENIDYVLLPAAVWSQLMDWYGGGPSIVREYELGGISRGIPFVNLYPVAIRFSQWKPNARTDPAQTVQRWLTVPQTATLKELLHILCAKLYPSPPHRSRLWRLEPRPITHISKELGKTLREAGVVDGSAILVETAESSPAEGQVGSLPMLS